MPMFSHPPRVEEGTWYISHIFPSHLSRRVDNNHFTMTSRVAFDKIRPIKQTQPMKLSRTQSYRRVFDCTRASCLEGYREITSTHAYVTSCYRQRGRFVPLLCPRSGYSSISAHYALPVTTEARGIHIAPYLVASHCRADTPLIVYTVLCNSSRRVQNSS